MNEKTYDFKVINFYNPPLFYNREGMLQHLHEYVEVIAGKRVRLSCGHLARGDFLGIISDDVWYAGRGFRHNPARDWGTIAPYACNVLVGQIRLAETVVEAVMDHTYALYDDMPDDDATMAGL